VKLRHLAWLTLTIGLATAGPSTANDSAAELAAGGLVLVKTDAIALQREDLTLSPAEVRVRYEMRNDTGRPVTLRVAFPMPEVPSNSPDGLQIAGTAYNNIAMKAPTDPNFMGFRVQVDGRPLDAEVEVRAELPGGRDIAAALREIGGWPLVLQPGLFDSSDKKTLDADTRRKLTALGAIEELDATTFRLPWTTHVTFHWTQTFPPGVTVVEHTYRPVPGFRFIVVNGSQPLQGSGGDDPARAFCIDAATDKAIRDLYRRRNAAKSPADAQPLSGYTLGYILKTARNWRGPVGTFHLTLQGGPIVFDGQPRGAVQVTSLCTDLPLSRTGPQRFEATVRDYVPRDDLRVLHIAD
jgi:uncharacterized protein DUF4424